MGFAALNPSYNPYVTTFASSRIAKSPARAGHCNNQLTDCQSARLGDDAARGDHDPAAVLLADRMNAAETWNVVARRNFHHAELRALDEGRVAIDVTHRPAGQRRVGGLRQPRPAPTRWSPLVASASMPFDAIKPLAEVRNLPGAPVLVALELLPALGAPRHWT